MRPYHENFLFKRSVHPAHFILGGFRKKQRGTGSLAGGVGEIAEWAPQKLDVGGGESRQGGGPTSGCQ